MVDFYDDGEIIALYWGHDLEEEQAQELADNIEQRYPDHEIELYFGGQPLYYFLISVE
jgi:dihydroxyacetone kinase-like predicted kinase